MKRIFCLLFALLMLSGCALADGGNTDTPPQTTTEPTASESAEELVGVWIPIYEIAPDSDADAEGYASSVSEMMKSISKFGITDVFLQVRANCDAIYPSEYFSPAEKYCANGKLRFDALEIILNKAHENNLKLHAWINPYRISSSAIYDTENKMFDFIGEKDVSSGKSYTYLRPSSAEGRRLILNGVREILEKYDVDGVHIDDYFYPTTDKSFDEEDYSAYRKQDGRLTLDEWRRENVNLLVSSLYALVKGYKEDCVFSVSPVGNIEAAYNKSYADVKTWCSCEGFADIIIPQIYYGFENSSQPFKECLSQWMKITDTEKVKLVIGLAVYKAGKTDEFAGEGKNEWKENRDIIKRQIEHIREQNLNGFAFFSYNYIFRNNYLKNNEIFNMENML